MPTTCVVPNCNTNYHKSGLKRKFFSFPTDPEISKKWIIAIKRKNFTPTKHSKVCSLHFQETDLIRGASIYDDPKTGRTVTSPLGCIRLKKNAVPSLFNVSDHNKSLNEDQEGIVLRHRQFSPRLQQNIASTKLESSHLTDTLKSKISLENENKNNLKKMPVRKKRKQQSEGSATDEVDDFSVRRRQNNNQEASSNNLEEKIHCASKSSQCLPAKVSIKAEKPWEEEYNYAGKPSMDKSEDCDELEIEIKDVRSVSSGLSTKGGKNKAGISESSSILTSPLRILKREEIFGKLVASELSDLCKNPELYLKTKRAILDILVQAQFEQIKCNNTIL